jgi:hypothetical protein
MTPKPVPGPFAKPSWKGKKNDGNDDFGTFWNAAAAALPSWSAGFLKTALGMTVALYVLNQKHFLPKPLSAVVSKALFWPTLPITVGRRIGEWTTVVDDVVVMGGAPFGFAKIPEKLHDSFGVSMDRLSKIFSIAMWVTFVNSRISQTTCLLSRFAVLSIFAKSIEDQPGSIGDWG